MPYIEEFGQSRDEWRRAFLQERAANEHIKAAHVALVERHHKLYAEFQRVLDRNIKLEVERNRDKVRYHAFNYQSRG